MKLILGSGSPRRKEIMTRLGYEYEIVKAEKEEITSKIKPAEVVMELSYNKALEVKDKISQRDDCEKEEYLILTADTIVAVDEEILGKPVDREDAYKMISKLQGRSHQVFTGITIVDLEGKVCHNFFDKTDVYVKNMTANEIKEYIASGESDDKAGAYAIQGIFGQYIDHFEGDYDNVVGLPAKKVDQILKEICYGK